MVSLGRSCRAAGKAPYDSDYAFHQLDEVEAAAKREDDEEEVKFNFEKKSKFVISTIAGL